MGQDFPHRLGGRGGIEGDPGPSAGFADAAHRAVQVRRGLDVDADHVGAGLDVVGQAPLGRLDHEVRIQDQGRDPAERPDDRGADGQVGQEVAVHHVDVDDGGAAGFDLPDRFAQVGEVGRQEGGGDGLGSAFIATPPG